MLTAIQQPFFVVVFILLGICMIACLIAAIRGPELGDRIVNSISDLLTGWRGCGRGLVVLASTFS